MRCTFSTLTVWGAVVILPALTAGTSPAAIIITVDAFGGGDYLTIQEAVTAAGIGDTISILTAGAHTENSINITNKNLTITGAGANVTIVQAHADRLTASGRIFTVSGSNVTFENMTLQHGYLENAGSGGAISISGVSQVVIQGCLIKDNDIVDVNVPRFGGGVYFPSANAGSTMTILDSTFSNNTVNTLASVQNSPSSGGAVCSGGIDALVIRNCTFSHNSLAARNWPYGGAVTAGPGTGETADIQNCTFVGNHTENGGGGAINGGTADRTIVDSCVFDDNTISKSSSYGTDCAKVTLTNSVYEGTLYQCVNLGPNVSTADAGVDPNLAGNGGPTPTHALLAGSPAIDAGSNPAGLLYDQRGAPYARAVDGDGNGSAIPDAGAYEVPEPATLALLALGVLPLLRRRRRK